MPRAPQLGFVSMCFVLATMSVPAAQAGGILSLGLFDGPRAKPAIAVQSVSVTKADTSYVLTAGPLTERIFAEEQIKKQLSRLGINGYFSLTDFSDLHSKPLTAAQEERLQRRLAETGSKLLIEFAAERKSSDPACEYAASIGPRTAKTDCGGMISTTYRIKISDAQTGQDMSVGEVTVSNHTSGGSLLSGRIKTAEEKSAREAVDSFFSDKTFQRVLCGRACSATPAKTNL